MKKILVVDDSEVSLFLIQTIYQDISDIQIEIEINSKNALSRLREEQFDLLLLDLMMPYIDGFQLLEEIRSEVEFNYLPILIISAKHDPHSIETALQLGVQGYIKKPISITEIKDKVQEVISI